MNNILNNSRWRMYRMGLVDFWYYTNEEFYFEDGHMLLRGSNGSGKSVTLQSIIPLLLDGNKSSERLDSFGTRARKMETYLIDEESDRNDRIAYLYLEFKREDSQIYKTIGMGIRARKNKPLESWYFVIEDNRRINYDIKLFDRGLAISKQSLKNIIGDQLIDYQKDYVNRVNKALFGFDDINDYKETINLLVQLRSPKLSNSLKPSLINEILNNSLQPLSEEDLRPMSEAISNLDEIEDQLAILKQSYQAAKQIFNYYDQYNYYCLDHKASIALSKRNKLNELKNEIDKIKEDKTYNLNKQEEITKFKDELIIQKEVLKEELRVVDNPELFKLSEDVSIKKQTLVSKQNAYKNKQNQEDNKNDKYIDTKNILNKYLDKLDNISDKIDDIIKDMDDIQTNIYFDEHYALKEELLSKLDYEYDYNYIFNKIKKEINQINEALVIFNQIDNENMIIDRINNEIETKEYNAENVERLIENTKKDLYKLIDEMVESFSLWNDTNNHLTLSSDEMFKVIDIIENFEYEDGFNKIEEIITNNYNKLYQELSTKKVEKEIYLSDKKREKLSIESDLNYWKTLKDITPFEDEYMSANRRYLDQNNIKYRPFYSLLEFKEDIKDRYKDNFEEYLNRMGLLNALVVNNKDYQKVLEVEEGLSDSYLFTDIDIDDLDMCYIDERMDIIGIFEKLSINHSGLDINQDYYQNGVIKGTISKQVKSVYIGKLSREQYKEKMIDELNQKLILIKDNIDENNNILEKIKNNIDELNKERNTYPSKDGLVNIKDRLKLANLELEQIDKQIKKSKEDLHEHKIIIKKYNLDVTEIADKLGISCVKNVFIDRKANFEEYQKELHELKNAHIEYISNNDLYLNSKNTLENLSIDLDNIRYEKNILENDIKKLESQIISIERQLEEKNFSDKKKRIEEINNNLVDIEHNFEKCNHQLGNIEASLKQNDDNLKLKESEYEVASNEYDSSYNIFLEELNLNYVSDQDLSLDDVHKYVISKYPKLDKKETINNNLQTSFHTNKGSLNEYRINLISIFNDKSEGERLDIIARHQGNNIKFNELLKILEETIESQKLLFNERDRYLVEDILVNTLSSKIRQHIHSSRKWIEKMNDHMNSMKTSSGLNISLKWHANKGQNENELDSDDLVKLLEKDQAILRDSDFAKLSSHFRSKIKAARQISEMEDNRNSFHQIMKEIMDYRSWFDFEIWYQKKGENKKEMTNNAFFAFSGGEKAMAMYIPLFSAVAAKYDQAREDSPMIIALDEAFAGVDEKNIDNLFALINKFNFDYIMNSQVLWGDYQSVKALAIHELFRPENAHYVTVISYKWNGKTKRMVDDIWA